MLPPSARILAMHSQQQTDHNAGYASTTRPAAVGYAEVPHRQSSQYELAGYASGVSSMSYSHIDSMYFSVYGYPTDGDDPPPPPPPPPPLATAEDITLLSATSSGTNNTAQLLSPHHPLHPANMSSRTSSMNSQENEQQHMQQRQSPPSAPMTPSRVSTFKPEMTPSGGGGVRSVHGTVERRGVGGGNNNKQSPPLAAQHQQNRLSD
jgi:hypothetical protein